MTLPVNLDNLHEMTGGDTALEQELFAVYLESSEKSLADLSDSLRDGDAPKWKASAHAWKGTSLNLGAEDLAALCDTACHAPDLTDEKKKELLSAIQESYAQVKTFLEHIK